MLEKVRIIIFVNLFHFLEKYIIDYLHINMTYLCFTFGKGLDISLHF